MSVTYIPIYTQVASGSSTTIVFNNIPQTFSDLYVALSVRSAVSATGTDCWGQINQNNAAIYSTTRLYGTGSSPASDRQTGQNIYRIGDQNAATSTANTFTSQSVYIPNYRSTQFKSIVTESGQESSSATLYYHMANAHLFSSTTPITSLSFLSGAGNFVAGSTFSLYGVTRFGE
jgi:hypothetical protein